MNYVYKYVKNNEIIYVGITKRMLNQRLSEHGTEYDNICEEGRKDIADADAIYYWRAANSIMADVVESELIRIHKPKWNVAKKSEWDGLPFPELEWHLWTPEFKEKRKKTPDAQILHARIVDLKKQMRVIEDVLKIEDELSEENIQMAWHCLQAIKREKNGEALPATQHLLLGRVEKEPIVILSEIPESFFVKEDTMEYRTSGYLDFEHKEGRAIRCIRRVEFAALEPIFPGGTEVLSVEFHFVNGFLTMPMETFQTLCDIDFHTHIKSVCLINHRAGVKSRLDRFQKMLDEAKAELKQLEAA